MSETRPPSNRPRRADIRWPDLDTMYTVNADGSRNFLHPADVDGRFQKLKHLVFAVLIAVYVLLPWIPIDGRPAVHIDIPGRQGFLFGATYTNQDFYLVFFFLTGMGFLLFVATALWGRVWCGYACPQTVFLEGVYRWIERRIEGPRTRRIRRNEGPWTREKAALKTVKHAVFLVLSFVLAHLFLAYFIPAHELIGAITHSPREHMTAFLWGMAWTGILYFNYSWFREQTCLVICPYGRIQSSLIDTETVVVGYDPTRGEPRSKVDDTGGDCIDCHRCVVVCPTGIDIRNGLQMECLGCANCIDACDEIMDRIERPRGLIRYDQQQALHGEARQGWLRPRVVLYAVLFLAGIAAFTVTSLRRSPLHAGLVHARGLPFVLEEDRIRNLFQLELENRTDEARVYFVTGPLETIEGLEVIVPQTTLHLEGRADVASPVFAYVGRDVYEAPFELTFAVTDSATGTMREVTGRFLGP